MKNHDECVVCDVNSLKKEGCRLATLYDGISEGNDGEEGSEEQEEEA